MIDEYRPADFESLEPPLQAAVKAALAEPIPEDAVDRVKARAKQLVECPNFRASENGTVPFDAARASSSRHRRWKTSRSLIAGLTAAAALVAVVIGGLLLFDHSGGQAFAQMIEKVKAASSVRFTTTVRLGKGGREHDAVMYLEGNRMRMEHFDGTLIDVADLDRKQGLALNMRGKLAQQVELDENVVGSFNNPIDQLRRVKSDDAEQIGEEDLKGRRTLVYRCHKVDTLFFKGNAEMLIWVDRESGLPAKIEIRDFNPQFPSEYRFDKFVWNEPLDARLFSLAIPDGFTIGVVRETPKPAPIKTPYIDNPHYLADGILSHDLVPAQILWGSQGKTITALMRDPESVPMLERRQGEFRQWDVATGKLRWSDTRLVPRHFSQTSDGKTLATVYNFEVELRNAATGKITRAWGTDEMLSQLAFSPDGKTLAAGIAEWGKYGGRGGKQWGGVQLWDVARASLVRTIKSDDKPVMFVKYSVDGKFVATSAWPSVKLWNATTGELAHIFPGSDPADFSPDGQTIACRSVASSADKNVGRVDLYNLRNGSLVRSFASEKGSSNSSLLCVTFSPDGRLLAATDWNGTVTLWDVASGQRKLTIADHKAGVSSAAFAPDGAMLATGSEDKTLRVRKLPADLVRPTPEKR